MTDSGIEAHIRRELPPEDQETALAFTRFLTDSRLEFHRDDSTYWKSRIYYWVRSGEECVCFIAIRNPDEPQNHWTVWSADMASEQLAKAPADDSMKAIAWKHVGHCGRCGSCGGGRRRVIFGRAFDDVCGCTFRIDNPGQDALPFLKEMIKLRIGEIRSRK